METLKTPLSAMFLMFLVACIGGVADLPQSGDSDGTTGTDGLCIGNDCTCPASGECDLECDSDETCQAICMDSSDCAVTCHDNPDCDVEWVGSTAARSNAAEPAATSTARTATAP